MTIETPSKSASSENRLAARQWIDAFNPPRRPGRGRRANRRLRRARSRQMHLPALDSDAWTAFLDTFLEGFPDLHLDVQDTVADEETSAQRILFTGTHTGQFRGLPPTGRKVRFTGLEINRMVDGKAAEHWFQMDTLTLLEQLGLRVVPGPHRDQDDPPRHHRASKRCQSSPHT